VKLDIVAGRTANSYPWHPHHLLQCKTNLLCHHITITAHTLLYVPVFSGKEYSKADSRYATRDDFIISMEAVTAFLEGPGCLLIVWGMLKAKPWRYTAILLVSLGQFYGDVLYFGTCIHGGERVRTCSGERQAAADKGLQDCCHSHRRQAYCMSKAVCKAL
jgi:hypothetical protein